MNIEILVDEKWVLTDVSEVKKDDFIRTNGEKSKPQQACEDAWQDEKGSWCIRVYKQEEVEADSTDENIPVLKEAVG